MQNSTQQTRRLHSKLRIVSRGYRILSMYFVLRCQSFIQQAGIQSPPHATHHRQLVTQGVPAPMGNAHSHHNLTSYLPSLGNLGFQ